MALKDLILPVALLGSGGLIIYMFTKQRHLAGKLALAEGGGRQLPPEQGQQGQQPAAQQPGPQPAAAQAPAGQQGMGAAPGPKRLTPRQQARLLMLFRANQITARQYLKAGGNWNMLRQAEDSMADGYMVPHPMYGPPVV